MPSEPVSFVHLSAACVDVGVALSRLSPELRDRLRVLALTTETVRDGQRIVENAHAFFHYYEIHKPQQRFTANEKRVVVIGSLFADIGKTGPLRANAADQRLIAEMFSVEGVRDDQQSVAQFLGTSFPHDVAERIQRFTALGLDARMTIRAFWNLHAVWSLQILRTAGVPKEAVAAAAAHHLLENVNPEAIVGLDGVFSASFGENIAFDRAEKLVILLDKYDAMRRRSQGDHAQAIAWLRKRISEHPRFRDDAEFITLIDDLDHAASARP